MKAITLAEAEYVAHALAKQLMDFDEPVPPFSTRFEGRLESCIEQPFITYDGKDLYKTFGDKATLLFYLVIKNHPFENGNKRMAVTLTLLFLYMNGKWIDVKPYDLYEVAKDVAQSAPSRKHEVLETLANFFNRNITKLTP